MVEPNHPFTGIVSSQIITYYNSLESPTANQLIISTKQLKMKNCLELEKKKLFCFVFFGCQQQPWASRITKSHNNTKNRPIKI